MSRVPFIAGNLKMNKTASEFVSYVKSLDEKLSNLNGKDVAVAPSFTSLPAFSGFAKSSNTKIKVVSQNISWAESGAYTAEVSPDMLKEFNVEYAIIGHSERRKYFAETDETVSKRINASIKHGIKAIVCVGETLEEREAGNMKSVVEKQIKGALSNISKEDFLKFITIAYEPVWAIGTGVTASPEQAEDAHAFIRNLLDGFFIGLSDDIRILYGGSVKPNNISELMEKENIDGALVGGASLDYNDFYEIVENA